MSRDPLEDQEYDFYNTPDEQQRETFTEFRDRAEKQINLLMATVQPGAITYINNGKLSQVPDSEPEPMTAHKRISLIKSAFRIFGYVLGIVALPHNDVMVSAFLLLALAEMLGIAEENHEND